MKIYFDRKYLVKYFLVMTLIFIMLIISSFFFNRNGYVSYLDGKASLAISIAIMTSVYLFFAFLHGAIKISFNDPGDH